MDQFGFTGRILRVNLENRQCSIENPDTAYYQHYLGGRGIIAHALLTELPVNADPLGSKNKIIFACGLLTGNRVIGTGRSSVGAKSPLTGTYGESEAGGLWGTELRRAGYDAVIVEGCSQKPVYIWIHDDTVEIRDAEKIWGTEIKESMLWIREDTGEQKCRTALIGPGGENKVLYASIIVDCRSAFGRGGMGAVMGSKNLKAIAVKGSRLPQSADKEKILQLNRIMQGKYKNTPFVEYGTGAAMQAFDAVGNLPVRNYAEGHFTDVQKVDAVAVMTNFGVGMDGCFNCPIRCKKKVRITEGPWKVDPEYGGPEYETLASFGSNLMVNDVRAVCKAHELCNRHGLDTISTGATIAFAMECFENGMLTTDDLDGLQLSFGNADAMLTLIEKIARRDGIGELLSKGSQKAAGEIGGNAIEFAMQVKGLEIPYHNPRLNQGLALHYSIHAAGADHVSGAIDNVLPSLMENWDQISFAEELTPTEIDARKVRMTYELGLYRGLPNFLGLCSFVPWTILEMTEAVAAVCGWPATSWKLMKSVERGAALMRIFNLRDGFTRNDDRLPDRFFKPFPAKGILNTVRIDPDAFADAQEAYYQMLGWDQKGVPTKATLKALDLEWAIPYVA